MHVMHADTSLHICTCALSIAQDDLAAAVALVVAMAGPQGNTLHIHASMSTHVCMQVLSEPMVVAASHIDLVSAPHVEELHDMYK